MKKQNPKKLQLTTEKLALLSNDKISLVAGGTSFTTIPSWCTICTR